MIGIIYNAIALAFDGFIVCFGLGAMVPSRKRASISMAFGAFDSAAYAIGALLGMAFPWVLALGLLRLLCGLVLAAYGAFVIILALRGHRLQFSGSGWTLLPALLSLDNLLAGACMPQGSIPAMVLVSAIVSGATAYLGLQSGARLAQRVWFSRSHVFRGLMVFFASLVLIAL